MVSNEIIFYTALFSVFCTFSFMLFRMTDSKQDQLKSDTASTYENLRKTVLDPILMVILISRRGKYKPNDFFNTPEVVLKLSEYRKHLFIFNRVSGMQNNIVMMLKLLLKISVCIGLMTALLIMLNMLDLRLVYKYVSMEIIIGLMHGILLTLIVIFGFFLKNYCSINNLFNEQIIELKGGLP